MSSDKHTDSNKKDCNYIVGAKMLVRMTSNDHEFFLMWRFHEWFRLTEKPKNYIIIFNDKGYVLLDLCYL